MKKTRQVLGPRGQVNDEVLAHFKAHPDSHASDVIAATGRARSAVSTALVRLTKKKILKRVGYGHYQLVAPGADLETPAPNGNGKRRNIKDLILGALEAGPSRGPALASKLDLKPVNVSYHLQHLKRAGRIELNASKEWILVQAPALPDIRGTHVAEVKRADLRDVRDNGTIYRRFIEITYARAREDLDILGELIGIDK